MVSDPRQPQTHTARSPVGFWVIMRPDPVGAAHVARIEETNPILIGQARERGCSGGLAAVAEKGQAVAKGPRVSKVSRASVESSIFHGFAPSALRLSHSD